MTTLETRAILAPKIRLGRVVIYFYLTAFIVVGIIAYLANG
ncbi:hypothetical protein [Bdellovibrio bacteriovorus]|nr:hypothetical protein [Bdellovibrio bacteriovorus]